MDNTPAVIPTDDQLFNESKKEARKISTIKAAVMLPFMTDGKGNRDEQTRMVEYYEGFLMAVDSLKEKEYPSTCTHTIPITILLPSRTFWIEVN